MYYNIEKQIIYCTLYIIKCINSLWKGILMIINNAIRSNYLIWLNNNHNNSHNFLWILVIEWTNKWIRGIHKKYEHN